MVLIGLALVAVALLPATAGAGGTQGHHLEFRLSAPPHQDLVGESAILIRARCLRESCTVVASAKASSPALHTGTARARIGAGAAETIALPLPPRQRGKLKAALEAGRPLTFTVSAIARDNSGTSIPLSIEVKAQKP